MADELGWVIEHRNSAVSEPNYWAGNGWSTDNQRAIRFARKIDAERTATGFDEDDPLPGEQPHRIAEHMWCDGPCTEEESSTLTASENEKRE